MRYLILSTAFTAGLILGACGQDIQTEAQDSPSLDIASSEAKSQSPVSEKISAVNSQGLSPSEQEEFTALQEKQTQGIQAQRAAFKAWQAQDPASRGPRPTRNPTLISLDEIKRFNILKAKIKQAELRKNYEKFVPEYLSQDELNELLALQKEQADIVMNQQEKILIWDQQDPASRGPRPTFTHKAEAEKTQRIGELYRKISLATQAQGRAQQLAAAREKFNINISEHDMAELSKLEAEKREIEQALNLSTQEAQKETARTGKPLSQQDIFNKIPRDQIQKRWEIEQRIKAIQAPLKAAQAANRIRERMSTLSKQSGVTVLSSEIEEVIALEAEKLSLSEKAQREHYQKWLDGGDLVPSPTPIHSDADYARIKEIEARLKSISAPMETAMSAAQEAKNPALRERRLAQEKRQKWATIWQDKKQAGEIPRDAIMHTPSYAEIQDRTEGYRAKLSARADKAGVNVSQADIARLEALNADMLAIRKSIYDMEVNGTSMVTNDNGSKSPDFKLTAGMYKIRLIEAKQGEILAALTEAEAFQNNAGQNAVQSYGSGSAHSSQIGTRGFNHSQPSTSVTPHDGTLRGQALIDSFRQREMPLTQEDADALLAFEREMESR